MRCRAAVMPMNASPETTLATASVTMSCIIEKPRWDVGFCFRLVRLVLRIGALITPPGCGNLGDFRQNFPWSKEQRLCQPRITCKYLGFLRGFLDRGRRVVTKDRKSTRLNSSHLVISYAVFCL